MNENCHRDKSPGPDPEHLKLNEDDWGEAVEKSFDKGKPPPGWDDDKATEKQGPAADSDDEAENQG